MGGYGAGLYWWKWQDDNYRNNFTALSSFMSGIDFEGNKFNNSTDSPQKWGAVGNAWDIFSFTLVNYNKTFAMGWMQNNHHFWKTDPICGSESTQGVSSNTTLEIKGLKVWNGWWRAKYTVDWYRTPHSGAVSIYNSDTYMTTLSGKLKIDVHDMFNWADDYAYKISLSGSREATERTFESDTIHCPNDTLSFDGLFGDDTLGTLYSYHWDFGNGTTSQLAHPKVFFSTPGIYMTTLIINDNNGITDTLTEQIVVLNCDSSDNRKVTLLNSSNIEEKEDGVFKIYPNPTTGIFTLQFSDKLDSGIYVHGTLGNCIWKKQVIASENQNISIDLTYHPKGIYIIKVVNSKGTTHIGKLILN